MIKTAILFILLTLSGILHAQEKLYSFGASAGLGSITGRTPDITALGTEVFFQFEPSFLDFAYFNLSFMHARKLEYFLPDNKSSTYYPFINNYTFSFSVTQPFFGRLFLEESLGYSIINDHTFSSETRWAHGIDFTIFANLLPKYFYDGISFSVGFKYGVTFSPESASYVMLMFRSAIRFGYNY